MKSQVVKVIIFGILINALLVAIAYIPQYVIKKFVVPFSKGFDPADATISLTVKPNTISSELAAWGPVVIAGILMALIELSIAFYRQRAMKQTSKEPESVELVRGTSRRNSKPARPPYTPRQLWFDTLFVIWLLLVLLNVGLGITGAVTYLCKSFVARPRPHFLHMCQPDYTLLSPGVYGLECGKCGAFSNPGPTWPMCPSCRFIDGDTAKYICKMADPKKANDMWKSFPSGHSSKSVYSCVFLASYLYFRMRGSSFISRYLVALQPIVIFVALLFGLVCSLSRVSDQRHHLGDAISGAVLGAGVALFIFFALVKPLLQSLLYCSNAGSTKRNSRRHTVGDGSSVKTVVSQV